MSKMTMTGEEIHDLFNDLKAAYQLLNRITTSEGFKLSNDYTISGYTVNDTQEACYSALQLLKQMPFMPGIKE